MKKEYITALGHLLATYLSDLTYIFGFHRYKNGSSSKADYLKKDIGTFKTFIDEFGVARNVDKDRTGDLLTRTSEWVNGATKDNDVDGFATHLYEKEITHGKAISLASKLLFLNNPWKILPIDGLTRNAVGLKENIYKEYLPLVQRFQEKHKNEISMSLSSVDRHLTKIETGFENEIKDIATIRRNRFTDKLLWVHGKSGLPVLKLLLALVIIGLISSCSLLTQENLLPDEYYGSYTANVPDMYGFFGDILMEVALEKPNIISWKEHTMALSEDRMFYSDATFTIVKEDGHSYYLEGKWSAVHEFDRIAKVEIKKKEKKVILNCERCPPNVVLNLTKSYH